MKPQSLTMDAFQRFVRQKTAQLKKQKNAHEVEYIVTVEGQAGPLKARVNLKFPESLRLLTFCRLCRRDYFHRNDAMIRRFL